MVIHDGIIEHVKWSYFIIGKKLRANGSHLIPLPAKDTSRERVLVIDRPIDFDEAVIAIAEFRIRTVIVVTGGWSSK